MKNIMHKATGTAYALAAIALTYSAYYGMYYLGELIGTKIIVPVIEKSITEFGK